MKKEGKKKQREREKLTLAAAIYKKLNWCFCLWLFYIFYFLHGFCLDFFRPFFMDAVNVPKDNMKHASDKEFQALKACKRHKQ